LVRGDQEMPDREPIRLDPERRIGLYELALAGAIGGALGGVADRSILDRGAIGSAAAATADKLFDQKALKQAIRDNASYNNRTTFTRMDPDTFLRSTSDIQDIPDIDIRKEAALKKAIKSGKPISDIPFIDLGSRGYKFEGRHKARVLRDLGFENIPVELRSPQGNVQPHLTYPGDVPAIRRPIGGRVAGGLRRLGKALNPASIFTDAAIGSLVGAVSTAVPYAMSRPSSAGLFTAPGPGYEEALTQADILDIAAEKELQREIEEAARLESGL
jgi:hypothetical protein